MVCTPLPWYQRARFWLLSRLAGGHPVLMNSVVVLPPGAVIARNDPTSNASWWVLHCHLRDSPMPLLDCQVLVHNSQDGDSWR